MNGAYNVLVILGLIPFLPIETNIVGGIDNLDAEKDFCAFHTRLALCRLWEYERNHQRFYYLNIFSLAL